MQNLFAPPLKFIWSSYNVEIFLKNHVGFIWSSYNVEIFLKNHVGQFL